MAGHDNLPAVPAATGAPLSAWRFAAPEGRASAATASNGTLIGAGTRVEGDVLFSGILRIEGSVLGQIRANADLPATLELGKAGRVAGIVDTANIRSNGAIDGAVTSSGFIELHPGSRTNGDVTYATLAARPGAVVNAELRQQPQGSATSPQRPDTTFAVLGSWLKAALRGPLRRRR